MNKAFVREPEPVEPRCPTLDGCEGIGVPVSRTTLLAQLPQEIAQRLSESSYYCPNPNCRVAYFDVWGVSVSQTSLRTSTYPKNPTAPVCSCFGITAQEILEEALAGRKERVRELLAKAESTEARCETESPSGASCVVEIRRLFLKHFAQE